MKSRPDPDSLFLKMCFGAPTEITDEDVAWFAEHPDEIDEFTAPLSIHKLFLWAGALLGVFGVAAAKVLKFTAVLGFLPPGVQEFVVDLVFETGVALIGGAVTAYLLGILLNRQQANAARWRAEIRRRLDEMPPKAADDATRPARPATADPGPTASTRGIGDS